MAVNVPLLCVLEWNRLGPLVTVTLWGALPVHFHTTFVPRLTETVAWFEERTKKLSPILTVLVAARAGMASAPATTTATVRGSRLFMGTPRGVGGTGGGHAPARPGRPGGPPA